MLHRFRAILFRFRAMIFIIGGILLITVGLPITAIVWLITGKNLAFSAWKTSDELIDGI